MDTALWDHWSKFNFAYALDAKTASNVAGILNTLILECLAFYILTMQGSP